MSHLLAGRRAWLLGLILIAPTSLRAADKPAVERTASDRQIIDTLRAIHDRGATMYNRGDYAGCFRIFEGSLLTVQPLLPKNLQDMIAKGLAEGERQPNPERGAMMLHNVMEAIRAELRQTAGPGAMPLGAPRPFPSGAKDSGKPPESPKGPGKAAEPPREPRIEFETKDPQKPDSSGPRFPTLGTPTKAAPPSETPEPALISPKGDPIPVPMPPPITIPMDDAKPVPAPPAAPKPEPIPKPEPKPPVIPEIMIPIPDKK